MYGKLIFNKDKEKERALDMGIKDLNKIYTTSELASGDVMFSATGVTDGTFLKGVLIKDNVARINKMINCRRKL